MLIIIPSHCQICKKEIPRDKSYGEGRISLHYKLWGLPPFKIEGNTEFCSFECFLRWYAENLKNINVTMDKKELNIRAMELANSFKEDKDEQNK